METSQQAVADSSTSVSQDLVTELHGHQSEVLTCQWSPTEDMLASGWVGEPPPGTEATAQTLRVVPRHCP